MNIGEWTRAVRIITSLYAAASTLILSLVRQRSADNRETRGSKLLSKFGSESFDTVLVYLSALAAAYNWIYQVGSETRRIPYAAFAHSEQH